MNMVPGTIYIIGSQYEEYCMSVYLMACAMCMCHLYGRLINQLFVKIIFAKIINFS